MSAMSDAPRERAMSDATREKMRQVLAQSNQEMLRELANQFTSGTAGRSLEKMALDVADRVLAQAAAKELLEDTGHSELLRQSSEEEEVPDPQLKDLKAVPWTVWSGGLEDGAEPEASSGMEQNEESPCIPCTDSRFDKRRVSFKRVESEESMQIVKSKSRVCVATMHAGLKLLTTTQEHTWMKWQSKPRNIMLVAKPGDPEVIRTLRGMAAWIDSQGATVLVEPNLLREIRGEAWAEPESDPDPSLKLCWCAGNCSCPRMPAMQRSTSQHLPGWSWGTSEGLPQGFAARCRTWTPGQDDLKESVDLVVCVGGDGTLCWAAGLFSGAMPPVIAFAGGSLGFLTPFPMTDWMDTLMPFIGANEIVRPVQVACRMRFQMSVSRSSGDEDNFRPGKAMPPIPVQALNEVLVHRGSSGALVKLEVWVNQMPVTMVQGDGLIIATPTGSTAYSLSAGGTMVHPSVPGIILTPVCPHSLSFRPVVLPDSAVVTVRVPLSARTSKVMVAVDGKDRIELNRGDSIEIAVSKYPLPTVCKTSVTDDWFLSVNGALQWNLRLEQKGS
ncbi:unnamed protein product [Polarella glacialis]|uniref:NAD(+) kinase n=1 Tax=Polarella glacialis TaxID=89957 RepID=A0A813F635_POLGL|nr:unnamed protein product [Polarella glacialis]